MDLNDWKNGGGYLKYGSHTVFYRDDGQGDVLICIHGFPTASWDWHKLWPDLITRFRVVAPDMLGFGFSDKPNEDVYSIDYQATLHETLLRCLEIKQAYILAQDYGDTITQELLARYEDRKKNNLPGFEIKGICFLNGGLFPEKHQPLMIQKLLMSPFGAIVSKLISESTFKRGFTAMFGPDTKPTEREVDNYWKLLVYNNGISASHKIIRYLEERKKFRTRWVGAMQTTKVPLRLVNGMFAPTTGTAMAERYSELIPNADVVALHNIGHYPQIEAHERVLNALLEFLEKIADRQ
ncbi:MAG: alpha/beta hydrolase [Acidobacteria bacterium]|nr:alpha/beta hydrolase [Acidobacteriota bacterium]